MPPVDSRTSRRRALGIAFVFANFLNILLFAQLGFVQRLQLLGFGPSGVRSAMGAMGACGVLVSVVTARALRRRDPVLLLRIGFAAGALFTLAAISVNAPAALVLVSGGLGVSIGLTTVTSSVLLRALSPSHRIGLDAGLAFGSVYAACNIPAVFDGTPTVKAWVAIAALSMGFVATLVVPSAPTAQAPISSERFGIIARPSGAVATLAMLFALVWLDSAAFTIIQNTPRLKLLSWGDPISQMRNGALHLVAAVVAGWLIDRNRLHAALLVAYASISVGIFLLAGNDSSASIGTFFYVVAVSIYSTAIAAYAALASDGRGRLPIRWRAALVVAVCGVGSTLGIAMAQANNSVPVPFVVAGGVVMVMAFVRLAFSPA